MYINIFTGTENIIKVCKQENVQYLVYCGTIGSFYGYDEVENGTETSVQIPNICAHGQYGETKRLALEIVMKAHGTVLSNGMLQRI
jgi:nucleoside-diphosphate-sugar epimerase